MKFNNKTLRAAVKEWLNDTSSAEDTYGHISSWDTSKENTKKIFSFMIMTMFMIVLLITLKL